MSQDQINDESVIIRSSCLTVFSQEQLLTRRLGAAIIFVLFSKTPGCTCFTSFRTFALSPLTASQRWLVQTKTLTKYTLNANTLSGGSTRPPLQWSLDTCDINRTLFTEAWVLHCGIILRLKYREEVLSDIFRL